MRRLLVVTAAFIALAIAAAAPAQAREPVVIEPFRLSGTTYCGFDVDVSVVSNNEYSDTTVLADGTIVQRITGRLVLSFTNHSTGKTIVRNVSGPSTTTIRADGATFEGTGNSWLAFGPNGRRNTGEPALVFTSGRVVVEYTGITATSFSLSGRQDNGCDLLA